MNEVVEVVTLYEDRDYCPGPDYFISQIAFKGHVKLMELLFYTDFDLNQRDWRDETPFMVSCYGGHTEIVKLMMNKSKEFSIDLNKGDDSGMTGFKWTSIKGHTTLVNFMINSSKEFDIASINAMTVERRALCLLAKMTKKK